MLSSQKELFSVVVPTYNRAYTVTQTLDSIKAQSHRPIQLLVVDDGSTDDTRRIVGQWAGKNAEPGSFEVQYLHQENAGVASARNRGLRAAKGTWLQFFDSDDLMYPRNLEAHVQGYQAYGADMLVAGYDIFNSQTGAITSRRYGREDGRQLERVLLSQLHVVPVRTSFRRDLLEEVGPWNEEMAMSEDTEFIERALCCARKPWGIREPLAALRRGLDDHRSLSGNETCRIYSRELLLNRVISRPDLPLRAKRRLAIQLARIGFKLCLEGMPTLGRRCAEILQRNPVPMDRELRWRVLALRCGYTGCMLLHRLGPPVNAIRRAVAQPERPKTPTPPPQLAGLTVQTLLQARPVAQGNFSEGREKKSPLSPVTLTEPVPASIVIPTHGRIDYLGEALGSVSKLHYRAWQCLVVSDAPDEFPEKRRLVESFRDRRMHFVEGTARGANASRNLGTRMASGTFIFYLDDDDLWLPGKLDEHLRVHHDHDVVFSDHKKRMCGRLSYDLWVPSKGIPPHPREKLAGFRWCPPTASCASIRRDLVLRHPWDEKLGSYQDWDLWYRVFGDTTRIGFIDQALTIFRQHDNERTSRNLTRRLEALAYLECKYAHGQTQIDFDRMSEMERTRHVAQVAIHRGRARALLEGYRLTRDLQEHAGWKRMLRAAFSRNPSSWHQLVLAQLSWRLRGRKNRIEWYSAPTSPDLQVSPPIA